MSAAINPLPKTESEQFERIPTLIFPDAESACRSLGQEMADLVRERQKEGRTVVLGLATGATPVRLYRHLIRMHEEGLSFRNVVTFNLDEYYGLTSEHPQSYHRFMREQLFDKLDIPPHQIHIPDGTTPRAEVFAACAAYEQAIADAGGIDLQILGIGRTGHIGFNEPGSSIDSRTRLVTLDSLTRRDAARDFLGESHVPRNAITMGVRTILEARRVVLLAWGQAKAEVIARAVEAAPVETLPASFLQAHGAARFYLDEAAASALTRRSRPWLVGPVDWTPRLVRKAVPWLSLQRSKPILKLLDVDYIENGMDDLVTREGSSYGLNIRIFNEIQHTITGWPGGKPQADDSHRPERALPFPKRVLVFSPEPADEVLGMGGTLRRLVDQGHEVWVACLTSGNLAVPDEDAMGAADLMLECESIAARESASGATEDSLAERVRRDLLSKTRFGADSPCLRQFKAAMRRSETRASLSTCRVDPDHIRFLDLPFYELGKYRQFQHSALDVAKVLDCIREIAPHQIFATGSGTDPSSVGAVAFAVLREALSSCGEDPWFPACRVWIYRTAERDWDPSEIEMAVPFSPAELTAKVNAIFQHRSQRSQSPFVDEGVREAWQQSERRNQALARTYDRLGLAEYEAIEAFQRFQVGG